MRLREGKIRERDRLHSKFSLFHFLYAQSDHFCLRKGGIDHGSTKLKSRVAANPGEY
jgi:hypothetical protein